jgi:hypothetical protein
MVPAGANNSGVIMDPALTGDRMPVPENADFMTHHAGVTTK